MHERPPRLYIASMRSLWIGGIVVLGLLGAGCSSSGSSASTTTTKSKTATSTTAAKGPITPTAKDKQACAAFNAFKTDSKPTAAQTKAAVDAVLKAGHKELRNEGKLWGVALYRKSTSAGRHDVTKIASICTRMGLTTS